VGQRQTSIEWCCVVAGNGDQCQRLGPGGTGLPFPLRAMLFSNGSRRVVGWGRRGRCSWQLAGAAGGAPGRANMALLIAKAMLERPTLDAYPDKDAAHSRLQPGFMSDTQSDPMQAPKTAWRAAGPRAGGAG
jgi:hypothetical protein